MQAIETQSLIGASGLVVPGLGFALQDRGALFSTHDGDADVYAPGKRPFHTIIPGFAFKVRKAPLLDLTIVRMKSRGSASVSWEVHGSMCRHCSMALGNMQPQGHAQVLTNMIDHGTTASLTPL